MCEEEKLFNLLKKGKMTILARILEKNWKLPLNEYANSLWKNSYIYPPMEIPLKKAFENELLRIGIGIKDTKLFLSRLEKTRVVQTATHLTASEGPTFLALHYLALLGMPPQETYFVGAYSGVSFANSAWSGCLNYSDRFKLDDLISKQYSGFSELKKSEFDRVRDTSERRISLIDGYMRNKLVFQSKIPEKLTNQIPFFSDPIKKLTPLPKKGDNFSNWASRFCKNQLSYIFKNKSIIYFDINEVVRRYLITVLKNSDHPLHVVLFNSKIREKVLGCFPSGMPLFLHENFKNNKIRLGSVILKDGILMGSDYQLEISLEKIIPELEKGILCPSLFLVFTTLCFLNGFVCFGSFKQVEYLEDYRNRWLKNDLLDKDLISSVNLSAFTSGLCVDDSGRKIFPLDLILGLDWRFNENATMGDFIRPLLPRIGLKI